jgi:hypothetical protein
MIGLAIGTGSSLLPGQRVWRRFVLRANLSFIEMELTNNVVTQGAVSL